MPDWNTEFLQGTHHCVMFCILGASQVREAKARGRPYTIVFVGVNGVGKSTNLAKVAYWLLQNDVSVRACFGNFLSLAPARPPTCPRSRIGWGRVMMSVRVILAVHDQPRLCRRLVLYQRSRAWLLANAAGAAVCASPLLWRSRA